MANMSASIKGSFLKNKAEAVTAVIGSVFYIFMMVYRLTYSPLWFDEYIERIISQMPIKSGEMYSNIIVTFQPPLYNFLMHFWLKASTGILWFRLFNIIPGLIAGACVYLTLRRIYGYKPAAAGLFLLSCCYQYIYCVQECAEYQLMVMFAALTVYFYVRSVQDKKYPDAFLFVFFAVCAMYSQYGAMFIVIPFLTMFYIQVMLRKNKKDIVCLTILYGAALVAAAIPLYVLYASKQLVENAIAQHTVVQLGISEFISLFKEPGLILGYLFNIPFENYRALEIMLGIIGFLLIISSVYIIYKKSRSDERTVSYLLTALLFGYVLHYFLVVFHVYAMVHPGQSGGFYARYSYFYIPLVIVCITALAVEIKRLLIDNRGRNVFRVNITIVIISAAIALVFFIPNIMKNWHKTYDDYFADIWVENRGWEQPTYMIGQAHYGFDFYIRDVYGDAAAQNALNEALLDLSNPPDAFWLWRTGWGGEGFDTCINELLNKGYTIELLYDYGEEGQLAHVKKQI